MKKRINLSICNNMRTIRKLKGVKQTELAEKIGTSQGRIAEYETGKINVANVTLETALKIAQALGTTIDDLFVDKTEEIESEYKYGIFEASCELREYEDSWDFVNNDENISWPIRIFKTKEEAIEALAEYEGSVSKYRSAAKYDIYTGHVFFVAELEIVEFSENDEDLQAYVNGDGYEITPLD